MRKRIWIPLCASALMPLAAGAALASGSRRAIPDVRALIPQVLKITRASGHGMFRDAVLEEADGSTRYPRHADTAAGVVRWDFVINNPTPGAPDRSAIITYGPPPAGFVFYGLKPPFKEDVPIRAAPAMSLARAVALLNQAGYTSGFLTVTLQNLIGPVDAHLTYDFFLGHHDVRVDAVTGKVTRFF